MRSFQLAEICIVLEVSIFWVCGSYNVLRCIVWYVETEIETIIISQILTELFLAVLVEIVCNITPGENSRRGEIANFDNFLLIKRWSLKYFFAKLYSWIISESSKKAELDKTFVKFILYQILTDKMKRSDSR